MQSPTPPHPPWHTGPFVAAALPPIASAPQVMNWLEMFEHLEPMLMAAYPDGWCLHCGRVPRLLCGCGRVAYCSRDCAEASWWYHSRAEDDGCACAACGAAGGAPRALQRCSRCLVVAYCGSECQTVDWGAHKGACRAARAPAPSPCTGPGPDPAVPLVTSELHAALEECRRIRLPRARYPRYAGQLKPEAAAAEAEGVKAKGNALFASGDHAAARAAYRCAAAYAHDAPAALAAPLGGTIACNAAAACDRLGDTAAAVRWAERAADLRPDWWKAQCRLGALLCKLSRVSPPPGAQADLSAGFAALHAACVAAGGAGAAREVASAVAAAAAELDIREVAAVLDNARYEHPVFLRELFLRVQAHCRPCSSLASPQTDLGSNTGAEAGAHPSPDANSGAPAPSAAQTTEPATSADEAVQYLLQPGPSGDAADAFARRWKARFSRPEAPFLDFDVFLDEVLCSGP